MRDWGLAAVVVDSYLVERLPVTDDRDLIAITYHRHYLSVWLKSVPR